MTNSHDDIQVGSVLMMYSPVRRGWITPDGSVITNPLKAQRIAELWGLPFRASSPQIPQKCGIPEIYRHVPT